jgi:phosphatidate cytidylyltransferase
MLKTRVITAVILVIGFLLALFLLSDLWWSLLVLVAILIAGHEWSRLWSFEPLQEFGYLLVVAGTGVLALFVLPPHVLSAPFYVCAVVFWFVAAPLWLRFGWKPVSKWLAVAAGWLILLSCWLAMIELRALGPLWLLAAMLLVWVADIAAYFAGRSFGKHKLAPAISPGKTWEGVYGALAAVLLYTVLLIVAWRNLQPDAVWPGRQAWIACLALACIMCGISVIGDLFESAIKRRAGVKDSGILLPGHGGVLDRVDALLPVLPLAALIAVIVTRLQL